MGAQSLPTHAGNEAAELRRLTLQAFEQAAHAAAECARAIAGEPGAAAKVVAAEKALDELDHEIDERLAEAIAGDPVKHARELLACSKFLVDLERIGDLAANFCGTLQMVNQQMFRQGLAEADARELGRMAATLEKMVQEAHQAFIENDVGLAVRVLRADAEMDRLRNLIFFRHVEDRERHAATGNVQVVFMAQALERAGDHAKNIAEEVCHLISGHTLRHVMRDFDKPDEVAYIENIRKRMK